LRDDDVNAPVTDAAPGLRDKRELTCGCSINSFGQLKIMELWLTATEDELRNKFFNLSDRKDIANLLEIDERLLIYHLYLVPDPIRYKTFAIPKKSGGTREISAPATALKIIQRKLNQVLQHVHTPKASAHGFVLEKSIVTNARMHVGKRYVFNIDLKNFFPTINFGRVRGMFISKPYNFDPKVATVLAQICCFKNGLPQGAPTSPIISNMICAKMDSELLRLAQKHRCIYTRYADDITFSTSMPQFPSTIAKVSELTGQIEASGELQHVISENGFEINEKKVRIYTVGRRHEVTGLTVNKKPNVRRKYINQIRAMLNALDKYGAEAAEDKFLESFDKKFRNPDQRRLFSKRELKGALFKRVVKGKIEFVGMVRGKNDNVYLKLHNELWRLAPEFVRKPSLDSVVSPKHPTKRQLKRPLIRTEGKTDWKHLEAAWITLKKQGLYKGIEVQFDEYEDEIEMGDTKLREFCKLASETPQTLTICIFDNDNKEIIKDITTPNKNYKTWRNNVFSFAIPVPLHRQDTPDICIELYYQDHEIARADKEGRRLFLRTEFDENGFHKEIGIITHETNKIKNATKGWIIEKALDAQSRKSVALSKNAFAEYILTQSENFNDFDFTEFKKIFDVVVEIMGDTS